MSYQEAMQWQNYRDLRGGFNLGLRLESGFGLLAYMVHRALGGKQEMDRFTPHLRKESSGIMDVFKKLGGR
jgi:hypothetical protein